MSHWIIHLTSSFKWLIHTETKQLTVVMNKSLNHWLTWFIQTADSFPKQSKWLSLWTSLWIIDSLESFKWPIHSETKQVTVFMNESLNHWLTWVIQMADSFRNKASDCLYERVSESLTHLSHSNGRFIPKQSKWLSLWTSLWIIDSLDSFKWPIHSETKQVTVFMNKSLNHWLTWFIQMADSFWNKASDYLYERVSESLAHLIHSKGRFILKQSKWLSLWTSLWIIGSLDLFNSWFIQKQSKWLSYERVTESLARSMRSNSWFILKWSKWLSFWTSLWIIDSLDSFKQLIHLVMNHHCVFIVQQFCCCFMFSTLFVCEIKQKQTN